MEMTKENLIDMIGKLVVVGQAYEGTIHEIISFMHLSTIIMLREVCGSDKIYVEIAKINEKNALDIHKDLYTKETNGI